jgi:hypothetical protein
MVEISSPMIMLELLILVNNSILIWSVIILLTAWVVDSPSSHDFLDIEFPSDKAILDVMASIDEPKDEVIIDHIFLIWNNES